MFLLRSRTRAPARVFRRSRPGAPVLTSLLLPALLILGGCGGGSAAEDEASGPSHAVEVPERPDAVAVGDTSEAVEDVTPAQVSDTLIGEVATFGAEPLVHYVLRLDDGHGIPLGTAEGSLNPQTDPEGALPELARLIGARVRVVGTAEAFAAVPLPGFAVASYELLEVEGERPVTGRLVRGNTEAGTPDRLEAGGVPAQVVVGLPPESPPSGSRIWILGTARGDSLFVQSFGVLRPGG